MKAQSLLFLTSLCLLVLASAAFAQSFLTNGLVAYYPLNGNANDASGNGMDGIASGVRPAIDRFGISGRAYGFDGSDAVVTVAALSSVNLPELTLSAWVKPAVYPSVEGRQKAKGAI